MAETLSELKAELAFLEKRMSKIVQHPEVAHTTADYANQTAALCEKIKKQEGENPRGPNSALSSPSVRYRTKVSNIEQSASSRRM
jgi:uncharacterized protein involved in type VI secretion and phage assembly